MNPETKSINANRRKPVVFRPSEDEKIKETPESISAGERLPRISEYEGIRLDKLPIRGIRTFMLAVAILVGVIASMELYWVFQSAWEVHWSLSVLLGLLTGYLFIKSLLLIKDIFSSRQDARAIIQLQQRSSKYRDQRSFGGQNEFINALKVFYKGKPQAVYLSRCLADMPDYNDDREVVVYLEKVFLQPLDNEALRRISNYSVQSGVAVAISPWAALDMLLALWRSVSMINSVSQVYGIRPSIPNRFRLLQKVIHHVVFPDVETLG